MKYLLFIMYVLVAVSVGLVWCDFKADGTSYQLDVKTSYSEPVVPTKYDLQPAVSVQATGAVQKTQSSATLHRLSEGVEMLPIDMLRSGKL